MLAIALTGCGSTDQPQVIEQIVVRDPGDPAVVSQPVSDSASAIIALGEDTFQSCKGCHQISADARSSAGPNLFGVIGREAGSLAAYSYSDALLAVDWTWDEARLDEFLADPGGYLPGNEMLQGAVRDDEAREAVIAYIAAQSE